MKSYYIIAIENIIIEPNQSGMIEKITINSIDVSKMDYYHYFTEQQKVESTFTTISFLLSPGFNSSQFIPKGYSISVDGNIKTLILSNVENTSTNELGEETVEKYSGIFTFETIGEYISVKGKVTSDKKSSYGMNSKYKNFTKPTMIYFKGGTIMKNGVEYSMNRLDTYFAILNYSFTNKTVSN